MRSTLTGLVLFTLNLLSMQAALADIAAQLLVYRVAEPGSEPYISRIIVTETFLRLDQGQGDDGFILFDRTQKIIYSVSAENNTILEISPRAELRDLPEAVVLEAKIVEEQGLPELPGIKTKYWRFFVNGKLCRSAMVAPGLMQKANRAHGEYLDLLAIQHLATLQGIPPEMRDPCDLAVHAFEPLAVINKGLPLREWSEHGQLQELIDYRERFDIPDDSFNLPDDYQRTKLGER